MPELGVQGLRIQNLGTATESWDAFVADAPGASFCHLAGWRAIMRDTMGHECIYRVAVDSLTESWLGVLPLVRVRSVLFGDYLLSMPFLNYGGPLGTAAARNALIRDAVELGRGLGSDLVEFRTRGSEPTPPLVTNERKVTVVLELPSDSDTLWKDGLASKVRSQVRRPKKEGMEPRFGPNEVGPFYEVFTRNMRDLGTPVLPRSFFDGLVDAFPEIVIFGSVYHEGEPVAAGCGFHWRGEFEMTWASSLREYSRMAPNMLLYWAFMEHVISRGANAFNFGRCTPGSGTHRFKLQWGGKDEPLPWGQWSPAGVAETPNPERSRYRAARAAWMRLPLFVANRLGPFLARRIP